MKTKSRWALAALFFLTWHLAASCKTPAGSDRATVLADGDNEITYGFEAEYKGTSYPDARQFPWMDPVFDREDTGNLEIKSLGGETEYSQVRQQMEQVQEFTGDGLKSFHFRVRIPKSMIPEGSTQDFRGFVSRMSDRVTSWRLQFRRASFAMHQRQRRLSPAQVDKTRGSLRLIDLGSHWDIEIRGYMKDIKQIDKTVQFIQKNIADPQLMKGYRPLQEALFLRPTSLGDLVAEGLRARGERFTAKRKALVERLNEAVHFENCLPLYGYGEDPTLTGSQRERVNAADASFKAAVVEYVASASDSVTDLDLKNKYLEIIKQWGREAELMKILDWRFDRGLTEKMQGAASTFFEERSAKSAASSNERVSSEAKAAQAMYASGTLELAEWREVRAKEALANSRPAEDFLVLRAGGGPKWNALVEQGFASERADIRMVAWRLVRERKESEYSMAKMVNHLAGEKDAEVVNEAANALFNGVKTPDKAAVEAVVTNSGVDMKLRALALNTVLADASDNAKLVIAKGFADSGLRQAMEPYIQRATMRGKDLSHLQSLPDPSAQASRPPAAESSPSGETQRPRETAREPAKETAVEPKPETQARQPRTPRRRQAPPERPVGYIYEKPGGGGGTLGSNERWSTPFYVIDSGKPGPTVFVIGGVHGNEPAGFTAAEECKQWQLEKGKMVILPQANILAIEADKRATPGEPKATADLGRQFLSYNSAEAKSAVSHAIWELIGKYKPDYVVDLHEGVDFRASGSRSVGNSIIVSSKQALGDHAQELVDLVNQEINDVKKEFGVRQSPVEGSIAKAVWSHFRIPAMIFETTKKEPLDIRVTQHKRMLARFFMRLGMVASDQTLSPAPPPPEPPAEPVVETKPERRPPPKAKQETRPRPESRPETRPPPAETKPVVENRPETRPPPAETKPVVENRPETRPPPAETKPVVENRPETRPPPAETKPVVENRPETRPASESGAETDQQPSSQEQTPPRKRSWVAEKVSGFFQMCRTVIHKMTGL